MVLRHSPLIDGESHLHFGFSWCLCYESMYAGVTSCDEEELFFFFPDFVLLGPSGKGGGGRKRGGWQE